MITERNMIFANPQAYRVFPQIGNPYNTGITDTAIYEGYLQVTDDSGTTKSFANTSTIDFTGFKGVIYIDQYTDTGSVKLGKWRITDTIENDIMSSMVLWYDLKKQGATNESMAENPVLRDLSGNGHDATCYNFAWTEESGISTTEYPEALVSDGVDDYIYVSGLPILTPDKGVSGLPILTPDKGYTVIAKRKWINEDLSDVTAFLSKASSNMGSDGAFMFEAKDNTSKRKLCKSFWRDLILTEEGFHKSDITYQTSVKYNDKPMNTGSGIDTDKLLFFVFSNVANYNGRFVLYSTILFDRDLTTEEIEWVKTNLIETKQ